MDSLGVYNCLNSVSPAARSTDTVESDSHPCQLQLYVPIKYSQRSVRCLMFSEKRAGRIRNKNHLVAFARTTVAEARVPIRLFSVSFTALDCKERTHAARGMLLTNLHINWMNSLSAHLGSK